MGVLALLGSLNAIQDGIPSPFTTTITQTVQTTVTQTVMAIGGIFQNISVDLDNGNGHVWDYATAFVTGDRALLLYPTSRSGCAAIYVYSAYNMTTIEAPTPTSTTSTTSTVEKGSCLVQRNNIFKIPRSEDNHKKAAKFHEILKGIVLHGGPILAPLDHGHHNSDEIITI